MNIHSLIAERAIGQFPISIATSLALESACGIHEDFPVNRAPLLDYPSLWVNIRTLIRNFVGSLDRGVASSLDPVAIAETILEEMHHISSIVAEYSEGRSSPFWYFSDYHGMEQKYKHAVIRRDNTEKQKEYTAFIQVAVQALLDQAGDQIKLFKLKLEPEQYPTALILTNYAYDLVEYRQFSKLALLESHTGKIKERAQWYTKYLDGRELSMIPFREDFLQVFGDKEHFRPMDIRLRKDLIEIATKYNWTAVTTKDKILYGINAMKNPYYKEILKDILI